MFETIQHLKKKKKKNSISHSNEWKIIGGWINAKFAISGKRIIKSAKSVGNLRSNNNVPETPIRRLSDIVYQMKREPALKVPIYHAQRSKNLSLRPGAGAIR